ncbi:hypothetical protein AURDEDRAFT_145708 [Auricularia subglabra TFB-10046 SS5]|nr:hypothetical protein AURDEDRAFT_145708 [Auricularia subglabra TFB-10046 SS5]
MFNLDTALLVALLPVLARGANDWSKPCVTGRCEYDSGDGVNTAYSSLTLNGPVTTLSDITSAAGWQISGCSSTWTSGTHSVALTCSTGADGKHCDHVLQGGAVGKIVRLPEDCGAGPFARVVSWNRPVRRKRGPGSLQAHVVILDYDFASASPAKREVSFSLTASNVRGNSTLSNVQTHGRRQITPRFSKNGTIDAPPINLSKNVNLLDQTISCPVEGVDVDAHLKVDVDVGVNAQVAFGYEVSGNFFPPKLTKFALTSTLSGDASAEFNVDAGIHGSFDTGSIELLTLSLPGTSINGLIEVGPQFVVNGQINGDLGAEALLKAGAKWTFPSVSLVFPPSQGQSFAQADAAQTPLDVSINPRVEINGHLMGRIIPKVQFGIEVAKLAKAEVFVDMDASTTLGVEVHAGASVSSSGQTSASAGGCVTLDGAIHIAAGASGALKPIFDKTISFDIFKKELNLFRKCFGDEDPAAPLPPVSSTTSIESAITTSATAETSTDVSEPTDTPEPTGSAATAATAPATTDEALSTDSVGDATDAATTEPGQTGASAIAPVADTTEAASTGIAETGAPTSTSPPVSGDDEGGDAPSDGSVPEGSEPDDGLAGRAVRVRRIQPKVVSRGFICPGPSEGGSLVNVASQ